MTDVTTSAAVGAATIPLLAAVGIDPASIVAGLAGCIVVQTLLPVQQHPFLRLALMTLGSVLFASLATPFAAPIIVGWVLDHYPKASIEPDAVKAAVAAGMGGFAQPILFFARAMLRARTLKQVKGVPDA